MAEPTVQVPVSLIKRAVEGLLRAPGRDAVLVCGELHDLLSQSTPTAEHMEDWTDAQPNEGPGCTCGFNGSFEDCAAWRAAEAEPPRIEDMAPGTTFTARAYGRGYQMWRTVDTTTVEHQSGFRHDASVIDPSTIRDVTPPAGD